MNLLWRPSESRYLVRFIYLFSFRCNRFSPQKYRVRRLQCVAGFIVSMTFKKNGQCRSIHFVPFQTVPPKLIANKNKWRCVLRNCFEVCVFVSVWFKVSFLRIVFIVDSIFSWRFVVMQRNVTLFDLLSVVFSMAASLRYFCFN